MTSTQSQYLYLMCEVEIAQEEVDGYDEAVIRECLRSFHWVDRHNATAIQRQLRGVHHHLLCGVMEDVGANEDIRVLNRHQLFLLLLKLRS